MRFPRRVPLGAVLASVLVVPAVVVVAPVVTIGSAPQPRPITPHVQRLAIAGVDHAELAATSTPEPVVKAMMRSGLNVRAAKQTVAANQPVVLTHQLDTNDYRLLGVSWDADSARAESAKDVIVTARTRTDGEWTDWFGLDPMDDLADKPSPNGRLATSPYWAGDSDGVQLRVDSLTHREPTGLSVDLIEPGTSEADAAITSPSTTGAAFASTDKPNIVTRAEWGADESLRDKHLDMGKTVKVAFVHHTAGSNNYGPNEGPAVVRGLYSYYIHTLGYADIGYNFLVDRYGHVYEGRAGSITKPVRQAATGGFNKDTMAVAALGSFVTAPAPDAMVRGIAHILAYRLSSYNRNPYGTKKLRAEDGSSRYNSGDIAKFKVISGHRDAGYTACPGGRLYKRLDDVRRLTKHYMGSNLVEPSISTHLVRLGHDINVGVRSGVLQEQNWTLTISRLCNGGVVRRFHGTARPGDPINVMWHGFNDSGQRVPPGRYRLRLTSSGSGTLAWPWASGVSLRVGGAARAPSGSTLGRIAGGTYAPISPSVIADTNSGKGIARRLLLGPGSRVDVPVLGRAGVPSQNVTAVAVSVIASCASTRTGITVAPGGLKVPGTRVVSVDPHVTARGVTMMRLGRNGGLTFRNGRGTVALNVAVVGYVSTTGNGGSLIPIRRDSLKGANPLTVTRDAKVVSIAGRAGVPNGARAVVLNVRRFADAQLTTLWAWPDGGSKPAPSSWRRGNKGATAQRIIVPLGASGDIRIAGDRAGKVALDVVGYVAADDTRKLHPIVPNTVTRSGLRVGGDHAVNISVRGRVGIPTSARAVLVELTGINASRNARLTIWPRGGVRPNPADLFVPRHRDRDGFAVVPIGDKGDIRVHVGAGKAGVRVALLGWLS